jgi:hypothetical protein
MRAKGFPQSVRSVLDELSEWRGSKLLDAIFERETVLPRQGQTDLLGIMP